MAACSDPPTISGGVVITSAPYADGSIAVYQCFTNYAMSGSAYINCNSGTWDTEPSCLLSDGTDVTVTVNDDDDIPTWLLYVVATMCGLLALLFIVCIITCCLHWFGVTNHSCMYGGGGAYNGDGEGGGCRCCCCNRRSYRTHSRTDQSTITDYGAPKKKMAFTNVATQVIEINGTKKDAKKIEVWRPHVNPVRPINTSTE